MDNKSSQTALFRNVMEWNILISSH